MKKIFNIQFILFVAFISSCKHDPEPPVITTSEASSISYTTAVSGGSITDEGGDPVIEKGVCWSIGTSPTVTDNKTEEPAGAGSFTSSLTGLTQNTTYFVRAYATNSAGTGYGNAVSFKTLKTGVAVISTAAISSVTGYSAVAGGNITDESGAAVIERGVCWATQANPTTGNSKTSNGSGPGNFSTDLANLVPGTTYYIRSYAINSEGTSYGNEVTFTTSAVLPTITTAVVTGVTSLSADAGGDVTYNGGATISERGICWSTSRNPVTSGDKTVSGTGTGAFTASMTGLTGSTTYYVRAYAVNSAGTAYGNEVTFTSAPPVPPVLGTTGISAVTTSSYTSGGNITSNGGAAITARGVCWNTTGNPTVDSDKTTDGTGTGEFTSNVSALQPNTLYYIRSYATNQAGTSYGEQFIARTYKGTVTDIEGNSYYTVTIGTQTWMAENLRTSKYRNGDPIATTTPANLDISSEATPKYQWSYGGTESNAAVYGRLYTWFAATDSRHVCPSGWHVATDGEWLTLENYLITNGYNYDGSTVDNKLTKALSSTTLWKLNGTAGATGNVDYPLYRNRSGFTAKPGGARLNNGTFFDLGSFASWWLSTESGTFGMTRNIYHSNTGTNRVGNLKTELAYSIRCVMD